MCPSRPVNCGLNAQPVTDRSDFAKGNSSLNHSKWSRVHAQEDNTLPRTAKFANILFIRRPGIIQWIVNIGYRLAKTQPLDCFTKVLGCGNKMLGHLFRACL